MSGIDLLLKEVSRANRRLAKIEKMLENQEIQNSQEWIFEADAMDISGLAKDTLKRFVSAGKVIWKCSAGGRKIEYLKSSILTLKTSLHGN